ncbi:MFS transporter [Reticulibacter mediterranei]|uniref:MFS transporter n=1 Tax=Reticulibacter mediterranei TaxID=2778369 RepID=A0A8J3ILK7_9CHLR|nr:MFS transporter [Reticulibacter mediterranei]GHO93492.1 MFS transporter [Reticulibacter mediterranei]
MQSRKALTQKTTVLHGVPGESEQQDAAISPSQVSENMRKSGREATGKWTMFSLVAIGIFMATLDSSIVNISLPIIARNFGVPLSGAVEWVVIAYLVATAAVLLTAGRLADMIGRKVVWTAGMVLFTVGSAFCGFAPSLGLLIAARTVQGVGGALLMSIGPAMLTSAFPAHERGRALGINTITVALGVSIGPVLGGIITASLSWRWIFYVNVPIGLIGLIATLLILKERIRLNSGRFDPLGALLIAVCMAGLTSGLSFGQELGWTSPLILAFLLASILALIVLPFVERRVRNPVIVLSLLRNRVFNSSIISLLLSFLALSVATFLMPFYFEQLRSFSTILSGILLTPIPITLALTAPLSGSLADRIGSRWLTAGGLTIACIGLVLMSQLNENSSLFDMVWRMVLTSVGQGLFQAPNNSALLGSAPPDMQGSASGFMATARVMGQSLSVALAGAIFVGLGGATAGNALTTHASNVQYIGNQQIFDTAFQAAFLACAALAAIGIGASLVRGKEERRKSGVK